MRPDSEIPKQLQGESSDVEDHVDTSTTRQAHSTWVDASRRMLNINQWQEISGPLSAVFKLTDEHGNEVDRLAKPGDYLRINIPGPGTTTGDGYDWVRIESIDDKPDPAGNQESLIMRVRPAPSPVNREPDVAHFFDEAATSTFMVERYDLRIIASVHGRNELPNKDVGRTTDKLRNTVVANVATSGMAAYQWSLLTQGILKGLV
jgi:hypothetical protein